MNWIKIVLLLISLNVHASLTQEELKSYDELEDEAFVQRLTKDGKFQEAINAYNDLSAKKKESERALVAYGYALGGTNNWLKAREIFNLGLKRFSQSNELKAGLGLSEFELKNYSQSLKILVSLPAADLAARHWLALYQSAEKAGLEDKAMAAFKLPLVSNEEVELTRWGLLIDVGLELEAQSYMKKLTNNCRQPSFYTRLVDKFEQKNRSSDLIIEEALACHQNNSDMILLAIQQHFKKGRVHTVVALFERLALQDISYHHHVAEFMGSLGYKHSTYYWRATTPDPVLSFKARAAQWVNEARFPHVMALKKHIPEAWYDDTLRYASGFAYFKFKLLPEIAPAFKGIKSASLKKQSEQLLQLANVCREQSWQCRP